ncbi:MAG: ABC transporter ATP-binding protein [Acidobacteria bacterium]|nr:ABC transporter ATP-binding protein [Acidobacteriota bacterium]
MSAFVEIEGVSYAYNGRLVLDAVSASFEAGELAAIVGPNGAGKSTLLQICTGLRAPLSGACLYQGREIGHWPRRTFAQQVAFVPQTLQMPFPFTAEQVVLMGRSPFGDGLFESAEDIAAAEQAMAATDCLGFRGRDFRALSGGERQRVILAAALAQSPRVLLLDEPTTFMDLKHQVAIYSLLAGLRAQGMLVIAVTHDVNLAAAYADRVLMLKDGRVEAFGPARDVLCEQNIRRVFEVDCALLRQPDGGVWIRYGR